METNKRLDLIFSALADSRRREMLEQLSEGKKSVGELAGLFDLSLGAISKHVSLLENADIIYKTKQGRTVYCHMNFDIWQEVSAYISMQTSFWHNRLNELEDFLVNKKRAKSASNKNRESS
ncbi:ArsR/SmtB family transcription factor [Thalassomonas actiniarum]|uniref:Winged helix-turn-helix transcriptional regulator n=1 Tax=Thalassomonas actiniarum TaxID=485447 RepID=A0AAE9YUC1_9GAMM|nr:metalloregulator ArsR/SmtB family transcription factor [Thalassomonas actiniarum]WDE00978.1 winged helix-turn-helix transcriptional regulator [Thalassomonas actiniarum]